MARAVAGAMAQNGRLIAEAGTGTGKTFAYLTPALLSGKKVLVSTGTKNLQDQLYYRDLPKVMDALGASVRIALLKGRSNYFCHYRFEQKQLEGRLSALQQDEFARIREWLNITRFGDVTEIDTIAEESAIWPFVTSTADNCLGSDCPHLSDCFVMKARRAAQESDVVVINHHLFFADLVLREEGFGEVLPGADCLIFDEAHQLPETAMRFFGRSVSSRQMLDLGRDAQLEILQEASDEARALQLCEVLTRHVQDMRLAFERVESRAAWSTVARHDDVVSALDALHQTLYAFEAQLKVLAARGAGLEKCWQRSALLLAGLSRFCAEGHSEDCSAASPDAEQEDEPQVQWYETTRRGFTLHQTPIRIAESFSRAMDSLPGAAWVFTSATLSVAGDFGHFTQALGIADAAAHSWESPFDYSKQALLYAPPDMPNPNSPTFSSAVANVAESIVNMAKGRTFILVTSYKALRAIARQLQPRIDYPLLVQGEMARTELLQRFRRLGNAVLIGTSSFWEGVDVKGEALSCVIIDRLPFSAPDDPVLQARIESFQAQGKSPFMQIQIPKAVVTLKQGVGRLIRDGNDRGLLVICDPRLQTKSYGRIFLRSLPPMPRSRDILEVEAFFAQSSRETVSA
jgi:ATP-dependent DNA helicase DinG